MTVRCGEREHDALDGWAASRGLKFAHIVLDRGRVVSQPMLTLRGTATLDLAGTAAGELAAALGSAGYDVVRTKIEMTPWSAGVPATDDEAAALGAGFYFEHHIKLALAPGTETGMGTGTETGMGTGTETSTETSTKTRTETGTETSTETGTMIATKTGLLAALAARHGAHLARNARRIRRDGLQERFVTQRCRMAGTTTARRRLRELTSELRGLQYTIIAVEQEFVVFDSDASLDHGWIEGPAT